MVACMLRAISRLTFRCDDPYWCRVHQLYEKFVCSYHCGPFGYAEYGSGPGLVEMCSKKGAFASVEDLAKCLIEELAHACGALDFPEGGQPGPDNPRMWIDAKLYQYCLVGN